MELQSNIDFKEVIEWFEDEKEIIVNQLGGRSSSEELHRLSGQLSQMNYLLNEIKKERTER